MRKILYILMAGLMLASCSVDKDCRQDMRVRLRVALEGDSLRLSDDETTWEHVRFSSVTGMQVWGAGRDSLIETGDKAISLVRLPLKKDADECAFVFAYQGQQDTLFLHYERQETFVSLACGCAVYATIDDIRLTGAFLDSALCVNSNVTTFDETHVKLYYHKP